MQKKIEKKLFCQLSRGFTTIELITVMSIFAMVSGLVLFHYRDFGAGINLENTAQEIALQIQKAENYALSGRYPVLINSNGSQQTPPLPSWRPSYGVYFQKNSPKQFIFFFDWNDGTSSYLNSHGDGSTGRGYFDQANNQSGLISDITCGTSTSGAAECLDVITIASNETIYDLCRGETCASSLGGLTNLSVVFTRPFPDRIAVYDASFQSSNSVASKDVRIRIKGEVTSGCRDIFITPLGQIYIRTATCQ